MADKTLRIASTTTTTAKKRGTPSSSGTVATVLRAFCDQLREPLILMFLFLAGVYLCLGNAADAVSIEMVLAIVSMVAAIQEYRSERGEWCVW
jgi:hypothetical protein